MPVLDAVYGYWSMVTSTPRARASATIRSVSTLRPQLGVPMILWWVICVGMCPCSPTAIVSLTLSRMPAASFRMWDTCMPPISPATAASAMTSSVGREDARHVEQAGAEAERAVQHAAHARGPSSSRFRPGSPSG